MNLEKRGEGEGPAPQADKPSAGKKPVVVYIMILFIVAFLLMALSFFMHQRSNTEALGELQHSVTAMQEVQASQEKIIQLQEELAAAEKKTEDLESQLEEASRTAGDVQLRLNAVSALYALQQHYSARDFDACRAVIQEMEDKDYPSYLPTGDASGVTPPAQRYLQLKEAVEGR